jgi:hypothetical protein
MDWTTFEPVDRLQSLLGPTPTHPWCALIPQLLLWSFRRFCIEKLYESSGTPLVDQVWDDHIELIQRYAPRGLESVTTSWFTPENVGLLFAPLSEYNEFFMEFLQLIDAAFVEENDTLQQKVTDFLDDQIRTQFATWLPGAQSAFLIFPMCEAHEEAFTDLQFMKLIQNLLEYSRERKVGMTVSEEELVALPPAILSGQESAPEAAAAPPATEPEAPSAPPCAPPAAESEAPAVPPTSPPLKGVAKAMDWRRKTLRRHGKRATYGKTLRASRMRTKTRKVDSDRQATTQDD